MTTKLAHNSSGVSVDASFTTAPVQPGVEWLRPADVRPRYGIGKSLLYELIAQGDVKSVCLRRQGKATGMRLVSAASLNAYIESHAG